VVGVRPGTHTLPPGLQGKLPEGNTDPDAVNDLNGYPLLYGSIVKFGPEGGVIHRDSGGVPVNFGFGTKTAIKGAKWIFPGVSPAPSWKAPTRVPSCFCERPGFDVDGFGRSFFVDAARFRIGILDTGGNAICWVGSYGNQDSAGPGSLVLTPEIPFCWPHALAVGDDAVYVGDRLNRRVVKVKLEYAADVECPVR
jgi:hypothetical protein